MSPIKVIFFLTHLTTWLRTNKAHLIWLLFKQKMKLLTFSMWTNLSKVKLGWPGPTETNGDETYVKLGYQEQACKPRSLFRNSADTATDSTVQLKIIQQKRMLLLLLLREMMTKVRSTMSRIRADKWMEATLERFAFLSVFHAASVFCKSAQLLHRSGKWQHILAPFKGAPPNWPNVH